MAFYNEKEDQDQEALAQGQEPTTGQGSSTIGTSGSAASTDQQAAANAASNTSSTSPTTFAGIQDYVNANKQQTAKLANDVGGMVTGYGTEARNALAQGQEKFNKDVQDNTVNLDERVFNQAQQDATQVANNQQDLQTFQNMRDAEYKGPANLETSQYYQPINQAFNTANTASENTQTDQGQRTLLAQLQQKQRGKVNQGALDFNSALLQGDLDARAILDQAKQSNADLPSLLEAAKADALAKAQAAGDTTAATRKAIEDKFTGEQGVQSLLEKDIDARVQQAVAKSKLDNQQVMDALKSNAALTDAQLKTLGLSREQYNQLKGDISYYNSTWGKNLYQDLSGYATPQNPELNITAQNLANADEYAKYAALNQLMGTNYNYLSDPSLAGTAKLDNASFDIAGAQGNVQSAINAAKAADAQAAEERRLAAQRQAEADARAAEERAMVTGFAVAGPVGAVVGAVVCFLGNTPIAMADGTFKMVQDLKLGDITSEGGMVQGIGQAFTSQLVEYKGIFTSPNHAIFDGFEWKRAKDLKDAKIYDLDVPAIVYPIVNERHVLLSHNGVVYADLVEHDDSVGMSDSEKLAVLNKLEYVDYAQKLEQEIQWSYQHLPKHTTQN